MDRSKFISLRVSPEELEILKQVDQETLSNILREGLQLYFDDKANRECKIGGMKVWMEQKG